MEELERVFDSHEQFNKWQVFEGMRVNESGNKPSVYISEVKLKRAFKKLTDEEIEEVFNDEMENLIMLEEHRRILIEKLEALHAWQLFSALNICHDAGNLDAAKYVMLCDYNDERPNEEIIINH